jgi:DNA polymerase-3 subunit delta
MKLRANQLKQHFERGGPQPLYIVSGEEPLLIQEACDAIRAAVKAAGFLEREVYPADNQFNWHAVLESANSMSLFGDRKLIEIRQDKPKFDDAAKKALTDYLARPNPDTVILIILPKLEKAFTSSKWFTALENTAQHVQIWPMEIRELPAWIDARMRAHGMIPSRDAVKLLSERVEGNLLAASQEIEKLRLLAGTGNIDAEAIANAVTDHARYNIYDLVDQAIEQQTEHALKMLYFCRASGEEPPVLLWAFAKELRTLTAMQYQAQKGVQLGKLLQDFRIWDKRKPVVQRALGKQPLANLEAAVQLISRIDRTVKGWAPGDAWEGIAALILLLGGHACSIKDIP